MLTVSSSRLGPALLALAVAGLLLGGCGSSARPGSESHRLPAAEPAHDPRLSGTPAGHSVAVGADPQGIAVDVPAGVVAVGVHNPYRVALLSARTGRVLRDVPITDPPRHLAVAGTDGPFLVPEEAANRLLELSIDPVRERIFTTGDFPHAVLGVGGRVFVGDERGGSLTELLADGGKRTIRGFRQPGGLASVGDQLFIVDVGTFTLSRLDIDTGQVTARLSAGSGPTHDVASASEIYVADTRGNAILTYSARPFRRIGRQPLAGAPYGVAVDPVRHRLWITLTGSNRVAELSIAGRLPRLIRTYATGLQPDTVAVDTSTGRVFVANQIAGTVQIIDPPS